MTEFKVGDKVNHHGMRKGVLTYGPFESVNGGTTFLLKQEDGRERVAHVDYLTAIPAFAVGDKVLSGVATVEIIAGPFKGYGEWYVIKDTVGRELQVLTSYLKPVPAPEPEPGKPFAMRGITYNLNARYEDKDGDVWHFAVVDHMVRGAVGGDTIDQHSKVIAEVVDTYGPLRKV